MTPDKTPDKTPEKTPEVSAHPLLGIHHNDLGLTGATRPLGASLVGEWPTGPKGLAPVNPKAFKHDGECTHSYSPGTVKA